jgi:hypothetical protein
VTRRATLLATGGFPEQFGRRGYGGEDTFAFLLVRERGEIRFVPDKLVRYRLSEFNENFSKRIRAGSRNGIEIDEFKDAEQLFGGYLTFARLMRDRYGARGWPLARLANATVGGGLVGLGLTAIHAGDRALAIRYYHASLRYRPLDLKTYVRMTWAALPAGIAGKCLGFLTPRLRRSLAGPPFHILNDRPQ